MMHLVFMQEKSPFFPLHTLFFKIMSKKLIFHTNLIFFFLLSEHLKGYILMRLYAQVFLCALERYEAGQTFGTFLGVDVYCGPSLNYSLIPPGLWSKGSGFLVAGMYHRPSFNFEWALQGLWSGGSRVYQLLASGSC